METTTCTLCQKVVIEQRIPIIGEDPKQAAARLLHALVEHLGRHHISEFQKLHVAASHYLTVLVLGCFDFDNEVLRQDAATARDFANAALNPKPASQDQPAPV